VKQAQAYVLDLTKIEGNGDLSCPKCGTTISPDDETEEVYSIQKSKLKGQILEEIVIRCNRCASQIHLTGFPLLQKLCT
jgi:DNA-directed RNA polymerase subunit RPC12/RpoP